MEIARNLCITEYPPFCPVALRHRELLPHHQTPVLQKLLGFLAVLVTLGYGPISPFPMNHPKWSLAVGWKSTEQTRNITNCHCCLAENWFCHHQNHGHHHPPIWGKNTSPSSASISSFSVPSAPSALICQQRLLVALPGFINLAMEQLLDPLKPFLLWDHLAKRHGAAGPRRNSRENEKRQSDVGLLVAK